MTLPHTHSDQGAVPQNVGGSLNESELARFKQRRNGRRRPFTAEQRVIPIVDGRPAKDLARDVYFHDISVSGVAFHWRRLPEFEEAIVVLDVLPECIFIRVRVERCNVVCQSPRTFVVGCSFMERMKAI